jgi:hypothetical protein
MTGHCVSQNSISQKKQQLHLQILMVITMKLRMFGVYQCSQVDVHQFFRGTYCYQVYN